MRSTCSSIASSLRMQPCRYSYHVGWNESAAATIQLSSCREDGLARTIRKMLAKSCTVSDLKMIWVMSKFWVRIQSWWWLLIDIGTEVEFLLKDSEKVGLEKWSSCIIVETTFWSVLFGMVGISVFYCMAVMRFAKENVPEGRPSDFPRVIFFDSAKNCADFDWITQILLIVL